MMIIMATNNKIFRVQTSWNRHFFVEAPIFPTTTTRPLPAPYSPPRPPSIPPLATSIFFKKNELHARVKNQELRIFYAGGS